MKSILNRLLPVVFIFLSISFVNAQDIKVLGDDPVIIISNDSKSGSTLISLLNIGNRPEDLLLTTGKITNINNGKTIPKQLQISKQRVENYTPVYQGTLAVDSILTLTVKMEAFNQTGEYNVSLLNNGEKISDITIISEDIPFNLSLDVPNPSSPEVSFKKGEEGILVIRNQDPVDYLIDISLFIKDPDTLISFKDVLVEASDNTPVMLEIPEISFTSSFSGLFKNEVKDANLILKYQPIGDLEIKSPSKVIKLKVNLQYYNDWEIIVWGNLIIFGVLLIGGFVSLFMNLWIPNRYKKIGLRKRLDQIAALIRPISNYVESDLRVNILVERLRLSTLVSKAYSLNPNSTIRFQALKPEIERLEERVLMIQDLDTVSRIFEELKGKASDAPAAIMDQINTLLTEATEILKLPVPDPTKITLARERIQDAREKLTNMTKKDDQLEESLKSDVEHLVETYKKLENMEKYGQMKDQLKDLFTLVKENNKYTDKANIDPVHYHWLSSSIGRLTVLRYYIETWENYPDRQQSMLAREEEFIRNLSSRTWNSLNLARRFRQQFEENVFAKQIRDALEKGSFYVEVTPTTEPRANQPVNLEVLFDYGTFNTSSAKKEFSCTWEFPVVGKEKGWRISHYFRKQEEAPIRLYIKDRDGAPVKLKGKTEPYEYNDIKVRKRMRATKDGRITLEILKFLIAFIVAILALFSGAKEQILKLEIITGLIAVFGIGFGADTIKNLITKQPQEEG